MPADALNRPRPGRRRAERRRARLRTVLGAFTKTRRRGVRRRSESAGCAGAVDVPPRRELMWALPILLLSTADGFLTLAILERGGRELNPVMNALLVVDVRLFLTVKFFVTAVCLTVVVAQVRLRLWGRIPARHVLRFLLVLYVALVHYQLALLWQ